MGAITLKQKREWAETLYTKEHLTQKEIASRVGVTEKTIGDWKEKFGWDKLKASITISKPEQLQRIYAQINQLTQFIQSRDEKEGPKYATSREADILSKLSVAANKLESEAGISDIINAFIPFLDYLRSVSLPKAQEVNQLMDEFIKSRING